MKPIYAMWPVLFGSDWMWSALIVATLMCFVVSVLGFVLIMVRAPRADLREFSEAWHRYDEVL